jgi:hypothetical protein
MKQSLGLSQHKAPLHHAPPHYLTGIIEPPCVLRSYLPKPPYITRRAPLPAVIRSRRRTHSDMIDHSTIHEVTPKRTKLRSAPPTLPPHYLHTSWRTPRCTLTLHTTARDSTRVRGTHPCPTLSLANIKKHYQNQPPTLLLSRASTRHACFLSSPTRKG